MTEEGDPRDDAKMWKAFFFVALAVVVFLLFVIMEIERFDTQ